MIQFHMADLTYKLSDKVGIKKWLMEAISEENFKTGDINIILCSDNYLLDINRKFLQHDFFTDIITFDYSEGTILHGELYISIERVEENAHFFNTTISNELLRVFIHGVLHLLGYKDKSIEEEKMMRVKETYYLNKYFN